MDVNLDLGTSNLSSLDAAELRRMATLYTAAELAGAMKPHVISHVLDAGADTVVFLDADLEVLAPLDCPRAGLEPWFLRSCTYNTALLAWLLEPLDEESVTRYLHVVWSQRVDVQAAFPHVPAFDSARYLRWVSEQPANRDLIPAAFMP